MKYYLFSLGCKVNGYEVNSLRDEFIQKGYEEVKNVEDADIVVINTCSVTSTADQKSRQHVRKFKKLMKEDGCLVVMGCYAQKHREKCLEMGADLVTGTSKRNEIPDRIVQFFEDKKRYDFGEDNVYEFCYEELEGVAYTPMTRAYLKVQDGCSNYCSYCLIPHLRGKSRSRNKEDVLKEARKFAENGYKEIIITGIDSGSYGKDLGDGSYIISDLILDIARENPSIRAIRISSIEMSEISNKKFIDMLTNCDQVADHIHIPLQSGSKTVLERMHRKYDVDEFIESLKKIREVRPNIAITTDVIAGFPGETDEEWNETLELIKKAKFSEIHVFPYSSRQGTGAAHMRNQVNPQIKKKRVRELLELSKQLESEFQQMNHGRKMEILWEEDNEQKGYSIGRASNYLTVEKPYDKPLKGTISLVEYNGPKNFKIIK